MIKLGHCCPYIGLSTYLLYFVSKVKNINIDIKGVVKMSRSKIDRTGETNISNEGCVVKIVEYNNCNDIIIQFEDEHKYWLHTSYKHFKNGECKNPFFPSVYGHSYQVKITD